MSHTDQHVPAWVIDPEYMSYSRRNQHKTPSIDTIAHISPENWYRHAPFKGFDELGIITVDTVLTPIETARATDVLIEAPQYALRVLSSLKGPRFSTLAHGWFEPVYLRVTATHLDAADTVDSEEEAKIENAISRESLTVVGVERGREVHRGFHGLTTTVKGRHIALVLSNVTPETTSHTETSYLSERQPDGSYKTHYGEREVITSIRLRLTYTIVTGPLRERPQVRTRYTSPPEPAGDAPRGPDRYDDVNKHFSSYGDDIYGVEPCRADTRNTLRNMTRLVNSGGLDDAEDLL